MKEIQAVVVSHKDRVSVARRQWTQTTAKEGIMAITPGELSDLAAGLDDLAAKTHAVVGDDGFSPDDKTRPRMVLLDVTIGGATHRMSARGFTPSGGGISTTTTFVVHSLDEADLAAFLAKADANAVVPNDLDGFQAADKSIIFVSLDDIPGTDGSTSAVDHANAVDGDE